MQAQIDILRDCVALLRQGSRVIQDIPDDVFAATPPVSPRGSIGAHFRHILNFYDQFLFGLEEFRIDYKQRTRDPLVEQKRSCALERLEQIINRLQHLRLTEPNHHLLVSMENSSSWSRSSVLRELDFLLSHTVHHYSLIAMLLRIYEINPGEEFGVAPSTLNYWKQELVCAQ
jgi:uncharacterized damage-inducible protein DinB